MKTKNYLSLVIAMALFGCGSKQYQTGFYEPVDPNPVPVALWEPVSSGLHAAVGSIDLRYEHHQPPPTVGERSWEGSAWRGERVQLQVKLWSKEAIGNIRVGASSLVNDLGQEISGQDIQIYPVTYVITDYFLSGCGRRSHDTIPSRIAADMLDVNKTFNLLANTVRPVWVTIDVPADVAPGIYQGNFFIEVKGKRMFDFPVQLTVHHLTLPSPSEWSFHLDLWQNPFAVARYYGLEPWSEEHWSVLPPYLEMLAAAGQKCITTSILHKPWGGQTYDPFDSMIDWVHHGDGSWSYDYTIFDRWVQLAMDAGITRQINCYSVVPWGNQVRYFDVDSADYISRTLTPGSTEYIAVWTPFLLAFRDHLKHKGWLYFTLIAMDERNLEEMKSMIALLKEVTPELKIALAGRYMRAIHEDIYDLCVFFRYHIDKELIQERVDRGWPTTFYTMCGPPEHPNNFTFSPPAEQAWLGWHAAGRGYSGFLRWAYNSWVEDPVIDSRFRTWPAGDTYQVYPGPRSSIRFERLREGIQDFEKIRMLRSIDLNDDQNTLLKELELVLDHFTLEEVQKSPASYWLNKGKRIVNQISALIIAPHQPQKDIQ